MSAEPGAAIQDAQEILDALQQQQQQQQQHKATQISPVRRPLKRESSSKNMNGPLYMQANGSVMLVRRAKRKNETPMRQFLRWYVDNQLGVSANLFALLFLAHSVFPKSRVYTTRFFTLSYYNEATGLYGVGQNDIYFVTACITLFLGLRAVAMEYILAPFAKMRGLSKRKEITRFSEQAFLVLYYNVFWTMGVYIYYNSEYWLSLDNLWSDWPNREVDGLMKFYMLAQFSFWLQQILVIHIEERRKDHWQMFSHHIITNALIYGSYCYHYTRVGNLILVLMDAVELFFPLAKCLKYLGHTTLCDIMFGMFMTSWFFTRHPIYLMVCWSAYTSPKIMPIACFKGRGTARDLEGPLPQPEGNQYLLEPFRNASGLICFNHTVKWAFVAVLGMLQVIMFVWFLMIVRVAVRVINGTGAEDPRTDDEEEEEEEEEYLEDENEFVYEEAQPLEEEVGVEAINLKNWERRSGIKRQTTGTSGVSLPGHSDRKELLGRIGCKDQVE